MLNRAVLMGRLTADPELRQTGNGIAVASFRLAVDRGYVKDGGERQADFINITAWRQTAEFVSRYFRKGQLVAVEGKIRTRTYTDKDGNNRSAFEVEATEVHFAERKSDSPAAQTYASPAVQAASFSNGASSDFEEIVPDEDLPF
ncbi:MAG: single-stranded DNA-binding protein [Oscillospiraceae bacterium]|nr:single-stranded DNA-binding protein [Oscillospiraceae bacterium]MBQ8732092.1 single-stranded DNA-binding protein [Oscillospiraceae bacterium]